MKAVLLAVAPPLLCIALIASAHAQSEGNLESSTQVTGGKLATVKLKSAAVLRKVTLTGTGGSKVDINPGDKIEGLTIASAAVAAGTASAGKWKTTAATVDMQSKRATVDSLTNAMLSGMALTDVKLPATSQTFKVGGKDVTGDFSSTAPFDLIGVQADSVEVQKAVVEAAAVKLDVSKAPPVTTSNDAGLKGDHIVFRTNVHGLAPSGGPLPGQLVAPKDSCFFVSNEGERPDPADPSKKQQVVTGTFDTGYFSNGILPPYYDCPTPAGIDPKESYDVLRETLVSADRVRYGLTGGILVAPFKFYWDARNFDAGATVGPYVGYRFRDVPGSQSVVAFAVGATSATVKIVNADGTSSSSERNGISAAFAYLLEYKNTYSLGALVGWDFFSKADQIPNSGKLWVGISLGAKIK